MCIRDSTDTILLDLNSVVPSISGPKRPQDKVLLTEAASTFKKVLKDISKRETPKSVKVEKNDFELDEKNKNAILTDQGIDKIEKLSIQKRILKNNKMNMRRDCKNKVESMKKQFSR